MLQRIEYVAESRPGCSGMTRRLPRLTRGLPPRTLMPSLRTAAMRGPTRTGLSNVTKTSRGAVVSVDPGAGSTWRGTACAEALRAVAMESATTTKAALATPHERRAVGVRHTGAEATRW